MDDEDDEVLLEKIYKKFNYPSEKRLYTIIQELGMKASHKDLKEFIAKQSVYQIHKPVQNIVSNQRHITASEPNEIWQIDLLDYTNYSKQNKGFHWVLIAIDFFTRKAYAEPIKTKTPKSVLDGFQKIVINNKPKVVYSDDGSEWKGVFKKYLTNSNIVSIQENSKKHHSFAIVDRFSRTIKKMISIYMTANNTTKFINKLPELIEIYNNSKHAGILDIKPNDAEKEENKQAISNLNWEKSVHNTEILNKQHSFQVGDSVRFAISKGRFAKGYTPTYSKAIHTIVEIDSHGIKLDNNNIYNAGDLQPVSSETTNINSGAVEKANQLAISKRRLNKEGLD